MAGVLGACLFALMMLLFTAGRLLVGQIEKRLDSRFATLDEQRRTVNPPGWTCSMSIPATMSASLSRFRPVSSRSRQNYPEITSDAKSYRTT